MTDDMKRLSCDQGTAEESPDLPWTPWLRLAREACQLDFGLKRVPRDLYREFWALGDTPRHAAAQIAQRLNR